MLAQTTIEAAYYEALTLWPGIDLAIQRFKEMANELDVAEDGLRAWSGDFYLACAAGHGNRKAIAIIDERYVGRLDARIRRLGSTPAATADVLQVIRERLFAGSRPRLRAYNAAGPLEQWIKVVGIRIAIDSHRAQSSGRASEVPLEMDTAAPVPDASLSLEKHQLKKAFEEALKTELTSLGKRDRTVLRLHVVEGVSIERIAAAYGVHRVTVARWIWTAGEIVLEGLRRHFRRHYGVVPSECDSMAHLVRSNLSLDLPRLLAD